MQIQAYQLKELFYSDDYLNLLGTTENVFAQVKHWNTEYGKYMHSIAVTGKYKQAED